MFDTAAEETRQHEEIAKQMSLSFHDYDVHMADEDSTNIHFEEQQPVDSKQDHKGLISFHKHARKPLSSSHYTHKCLANACTFLILLTIWNVNEIPYIDTVNIIATSNFNTNA